MTLRSYPGHNLELLAWAFLQSALPSSHQCRPTSEGFRDTVPHLYIVNLHQAGFVAAGSRLLSAINSSRRSCCLAAMPSKDVLVTMSQACKHSQHVNVIGIRSEDLAPQRRLARHGHGIALGVSQWQLHGKSFTCDIAAIASSLPCRWGHHTEGRSAPNQRCRNRGKTLTPKTPLIQFSSTSCTAKQRLATLAHTGLHNARPVPAPLMQQQTHTGLTTRAAAPS